MIPVSNRRFFVALRRLCGQATANTQRLSVLQPAWRRVSFSSQQKALDTLETRCSSTQPHHKEGREITRRVVRSTARHTIVTDAPSFVQSTHALCGINGLSFVNPFKTAFLAF